jgi:hypothetical protein
MTPLEFLNRLWGAKPEEHFVLIWTQPDKRSRWFTSVPAAGEYVSGINGTRDVYVGVGLSGKDYGPARRCVSEEVTGIAGFAGDFDLLSEAHKGKPLPQTIDQALSILPPIIQPTIVILTGNGLQAWWLLKEPYVFENDEDRRNVMRLFARWHTMLGLRAATHGWAYDRLSDLARVLRVPGTKNCKDPANPKSVSVHSASDRCYNLSDFEEFLDEAGIPDPEAEEKAAREWKERFADKPLTVNLAARIPQALLDAWMDPTKVDPKDAMKFRNTWERKRHDLKDQSNSGYDMALADFGVTAGLSEQQIVDLITHHRAHHGRDQRKTVDYYQRTIAKALKLAETPAVELPPIPGIAADAPAVPSPAPAVSDTTVPKTDGLAGEVVPPQTFLCEQISKALGVRILRIVKIEGKEPTYHIELENGKVEIASFAKFTEWGSVKNAIGAATNELINKIKPKDWELLSRLMLKACFIEECPEDEQFEGGARDHILDYLAETDFIPSIEGQRIQDQKKPMIVDGRITVNSYDFQAYLLKTKGLNISMRAAASMLGAVGAKALNRSAKFKRQVRRALPFPDFDPREIKPDMMAVAQADSTNTQIGETVQ